MTGQERRGKYRNRWRQMIVQEENEITSRAGKVKSLVVVVVVVGAR